MAEHETTDTERELVDEIRRYLAVVDAFRALGAGPTWMSEGLLGWSDRRLAGHSRTVAPPSSWDGRRTPGAPEA
jgi:hypothetical protein